MLALSGLAAPGAAATPAESPSAAGAQNQVDKLVFAKLDKLGIKPASVCSDSVFVRRVFLDVIGTLPTALEAKEFILSKDPNKRQALIDRLLERDEYADYWAMKWSDLLRVKAEFPINLWPNAAQSYHRWIRTSIKDNMPYDRFAREMLTASGSNFRVGQVNFYRAMQNKEPTGIAETVALTFMGTRADQWPKERLAGLAAFFSQLGYKSTAEWKEEIIYYNPGSTNGLMAGTLPDGKPVRFAPDRDPRELFADWLVNPKNPWFTSAIANRAWSWLLGRGIVHEPDDMRTDNPPSNPELLAYLERDLIASKYDLKQLFRVILNSKTYQLSSAATTTNTLADANFSHYILRRLDAEVLIDALCLITGTTEKYSSSIPEPFTFIPENLRSIALPDGSITSSFLEMYGRPSRDTGMELERNNRSTAAQRLHLLNSSHILNKIEEGKTLQYLIRSSKSPRETITGLYLVILSRFPTEQELGIINRYSQSSSEKGHAVLVDVSWALINSAEFLYRH